MDVWNREDFTQFGTDGLMKFFSKSYTLYGVYIFLNFGFRLNRLAFNDTKNIHFYISEVVQR